MFAGIAGMSAEEAWYSTALHLERARLQGKPATCASVDIINVSTSLFAISSMKSWKKLAALMSC
jgi:hypothetical protein